MPYADNRGVSIFYETMGDPAGPPLILIEGFTKQLIGWKPDFCQRLVDAGAFVIRYDNRDVGLSQKFGGRADFDGGYSAEDMADDTFAVMDALNLPAAHLGGQSMGGIVSQIAATRAPERVLSMTLFYTTGNLKYVLPASTRDDIGAVQPDRTLDEYIQYYLKNEYICRSDAYPFDEIWHRDLAAKSYERSYTPDGPARQFAALSRHSLNVLGTLGGTDLPISIIHGRADRLLDYRGSIALAEAFPRSELHLYPGLGHEIPDELIPDFVEIALRTLARGDA